MSRQKTLSWAKATLMVCCVGALSWGCVTEPGAGSAGAGGAEAPLGPIDYSGQGPKLTPPEAAAGMCGQRVVEPDDDRSEPDPDGSGAGGLASGVGGSGGAGDAWGEGGVGGDGDYGYGGMGGEGGMGGAGGAYDYDAGVADAGTVEDAGVDAADPCEVEGDATLPEWCDPDDAGVEADAASSPDEPAAMGQSQQGLCQDIDLVTPRKLYLSADDSNSMASPVYLRKLIRSGEIETMRDPRVVRTYEFLNYYRFDFAPPKPGQLAIHAQLGGCLDAGDIALQVAVVSAPSEDRAPMHVVLVLDTSGSMSGEAIALERAAVRAIASSLRAGDRVSAVTWSTRQDVALGGMVVDGPDDWRLVSFADRLEAGGGTDLHAGLMAGYALAERHHEAGMMTRLVLVSDGQANVGVTDISYIAARAMDHEAEGIYLAGVGVGRGFNDTLMDAVTDAGRGAYVFLDSAGEAERVFGERFAEVMQVAARDVRVQLTLPPYFNMKQFFGEEYSADPRQVRAQHLAPGDAMLFQQVIHACDPSLMVASHVIEVAVRWKDPATGAEQETIFRAAMEDLTAQDGNLVRAAAIVAYAEALKRWIAHRDVEALVYARDAARSAQSVAGQDADLTEIIGLLEQLLGGYSGAVGGEESGYYDW